MSNKSNYHPQLGSTWTLGRILLYAVVGLVTVAFLGWIFYHPVQVG